MQHVGKPRTIQERHRTTRMTVKVIDVVLSYGTGKLQIRCGEGQEREKERESGKKVRQDR